MDSVRHGEFYDGHREIQRARPKRKGKDGPLLSPSGRRMRHLNGISLRNITENVALRPWRRSNDDESIVGTWRSPSKLLSLKEESNFAHSKSSSDLTSLGMAALPDGAVQLNTERLGTSRGKRRSTRVSLDNFSGRPKSSEKADITKLPDSFFSLHHLSIEEKPIYISEVVSNSSCPNYRSFELTDYGPSVTWLDAIIVRVWVKWNRKFKLLLELEISLHSLQYIGLQIDHFQHPFPPNCLIFSLSDGMYTTLTDFPVEKQFLHSIPRKQKFWEEAKETSSYDSVLKMKTLEDCIYDARITRDKLANQLDEVLTNQKESLAAVKRVGQIEEECALVQRYLAAEMNRIQILREKCDALRNSLSARREAMERGREYQRSGKGHLEEARPKLLECKETCRKTCEAIRGQQRRIVTELQEIYPIEPIPGRPLAFTIKGLFLPNTEFVDQDEDETSAALGYAAHMVFTLSLYLGVYLRYPIQPMGSNSFIQDPISDIKGPRSFPLYAKGSVSYRLEYGVFLLNKNIELLMNSQSIILVDLRNTLPNLKYLLYVITSGSDPIPDRLWPNAPFRILRTIPSKIDGKQSNGRHTNGKHGTGSAESSVFSASPIGHMKFQPEACLSKLRDEAAVT